jgi:hypothetical protein
MQCGGICKKYLAKANSNDGGGMSVAKKDALNAKYSLNGKACGVLAVDVY